MDSEVKAKWVAALRSGDYPQTTGRLCRVDGQGEVLGYCCLGVLCEVLSVPSEVRFGEPRKRYGERCHAHTANVPDEYMSKIDLPYNKHGDLITLNDSNKATFAQIADWIEKNL